MKAQAEPGGLAVDMSGSSDPLRRTYAMVTGPTRRVLAERVGGDDPTELGRRPYTAWPAGKIAAWGFARPERLAAQRRRTAASVPGRPGAFAFGDDEALRQARDRVRRRPEMAGDHPFWRGDFDGSRDMMFAVLRRFHAGLTGAGALHPLGNPVACRELGPAASLFHLLDYDGRLTDTQRGEAAGLIADLAHLLHRRDFYPWHLCHEPPEVPYGDYGRGGSCYRGMLNQNFHTDVYAFVGLAGCVLPWHPFAARWRAHAVTQFRAQMRCFVWPDAQGYRYWEESHTYANHVKQTLLPLVLALRHAPESAVGGRVDLLRDPVDGAGDAMRAMCRCSAAMLSPPDPDLDGRRRVPAVGDHGYRHGDGGYGHLFGWLAGLVPEEAALYRWAWCQTGRRWTGRGVDGRTFAPLFCGGDEAEGDEPPTLPATLELPGFGVVARRRFARPDEALLVVRCGDAWGHHHPDQGSFWWFQDGRWIACDAGMGAGEFKLSHAGHNTLGRPGREPLQFLDRHGFRADALPATGDGALRVACRVPVRAWGARYRDERPIPAPQQHVLRRELTWRRDGVLLVTDTPADAPLQWRLWVVAEQGERTGEREITFDLTRGGRLVVAASAAPVSVGFRRSGPTVGVLIDYPCTVLRHTLAVDPPRL